MKDVKEKSTAIPKSRQNSVKTAASERLSDAFSEKPRMPIRKMPENRSNQPEEEPKAETQAVEQVESGTSDAAHAVADTANHEVKQTVRTIRNTAKNLKNGQTDIHVNPTPPDNTAYPESSLPRLRETPVKETGGETTATASMPKTKEAVMQKQMTAQSAPNDLPHRAPVKQTAQKTDIELPQPIMQGADVKTKQSVLETEVKTKDAAGDIKTKESVLNVKTPDTPKQQPMRRITKPIESAVETEPVPQSELPTAKSTVRQPEQIVRSERMKASETDAYISPKTREYVMQRSAQGNGAMPKQPPSAPKTVETYAAKSKTELPKQPESIAGSNTRSYCLTRQETVYSQEPSAVYTTHDSSSQMPHPQSASASDIKTKESYMRSLREQNNGLGRKTHSSYTTSSYATVNPVKTRDHGAGVGTAQKAQQTAQTAEKMRAAAQKAEKARAAAQKAAKAAKEAAQRTAEAVKELVREAAAAIKSLISAIASLGGWAVLIIVLIVVIIAAVIAASPFGIFLSDDAASSAPSGIPVSSVLTECRSELTDKIESIEASVDEYDRVEAVGHLPEWNDVLAVFAVKTANPDDENAMDVVEIDADKKQILKNVFWDMTTIDYSTAIVNTGGADKTVLLIEIHAKTAEEMIGVYHFSAKQREMIDELKEQGDAFGAVTKSMTVSDPQAASVMRELPDTLPEERKRVMKYALALVGKVNYFWGGKSTVRGWDDTWGTLKTVSADGSSTTGTLRPYGLDCSGFVTWVYVNAGFSVSQIGDGVRGQSAKCTRISWDEAKPGDLAFYNDLSHVGIIAGKDSAGNILVVHCNASADTVSVTGKDGFGFAGRVRGMEG